VTDPTTGTSNPPREPDLSLRKPWDCEVWWCARTAGHDRPNMAKHVRAVAKTVVSAIGVRVDVAINQDGDDPPTVTITFEATDRPLNVVSLDPGNATILARSIRPAGLDTYDPHEQAAPVTVWILTNPHQPELVPLDPDSGQRVARRIDRAVSILTEQTSWGLGLLDLPYPAAPLAPPALPST
jgi:hypothetical protein